MHVPSGRTFYEEDIRLVRQMAQHGFIRHVDEPFLLSSGIESRVYVFGREDMTDNVYFERCVGERVCNAVWNGMRGMTGGLRESCLIGIPTAGTVFAQAAAMASLGSTSVISHRIMREIPKEHGADVHRGWVNGRPDPERHCYWLVDNVVTSGKSMLEAAQKLEDDGYPPRAETPCLVFIDRQQGGVRRLEEARFKKIVVVYNLLDVTFALGEFGLWSKSAVAGVEEDIRAHQLI